MLLPGNEPQFLDSPAGTAVAIPTEIFRPAVSRGKHKYGKVRFHRENAGLLEVDVTLRHLQGCKVETAGSAEMPASRAAESLIKLIIIAYLLNVTWQLIGRPNQTRTVPKN